MEDADEDEVSWSTFLYRWFLVFLTYLVYKFIRNLFQSPVSRYQIKFDWKNPPRVGTTVSFRVLVKKESTQDSEATYLLNLVNVEIRQNSEVLIILKEIIETDTECTLVVKFSCQRAGDCKIYISSLKNKDILGSPFIKKFLPGPFDIRKSSFLRPGHTVCATTFENKFLALQARDRYENACHFEDLDMDDFKFTAKSLDHPDDDSLKSSSSTSELCYSCNFYPSGQRVGLKTTFTLQGIYECGVNYKDQVIPQGTFTMVVITTGERIMLEDILKNNPSWKYHDAKLLALGEEIQKRLKKIYIYVSPKQLYIRDYVLGIFPIRVATFRVSPSTKVELQFTNLSEKSYTYAIYDGIQPRVTIEIEETSARIVLAMFAHFLQRKMGGSESFEKKQRYFYDELRSAHVEARITFCLLNISRSNLIDSTISRTKYFGTKDWCKNFKIQFEGEEGIDAGGLRREWLNLLCKELFQDVEGGLFCSFGNSRLVHPNSLQKRKSKWQIKHYELAGKIVGKCLFETAVGNSSKQMVNAKFTRSFLSQILGLRPHYRHFEQDDPELYLGKIKFILESDDVEAMELTFTEEEYTSSGKLIKVVDLIPNGSRIPVNQENKEEYLNAMANYRLGIKVTKEMDSFLKGLHLIVHDDLLSNFDENELELLMCGKSEFDIKDLKEHHHNWCGPFDRQQKRILDWFWTALYNLSDDEKAKLLQFTTGSSLLPHEGFKALNPKFSIRVSSSFGQLPTAHTCVNQICISDHASFEEFERCLKLALHEGSEGFGFR